VYSAASGFNKKSPLVALRVKFQIGLNTEFGFIAYANEFI
jgi:hypothetical protein